MRNRLFWRSAAERCCAKAGSKAPDLALISDIGPDTYYKGDGPESFQPRAQSGDLVIFNGHRELARGSLVNGECTTSLQRLPSARDPLRVSFSGDPISSCNVNFRPSDQAAVVRQSPGANRDSRPAAAAAPIPDPIVDAMTVVSALGADRNAVSSRVPADQPRLSAGPLDLGL